MVIPESFMRKGKKMYITKVSNFTIIFLVSFFIISCVASNNDRPPPQMDPKKYEFTIGPEDILKIHVWKQTDLSVTVPVRSDGKISMPLANDIHAAGLTPNQLKDEITKKLTKFVEEPVVSVIVESINSQKVSILGAVNTPGVYKIGCKISLLEALSLAGGMQEFADSKNIKIIRTEKDEKKLYNLNYDAIIDGIELKNNITIYPGDSVVVPLL
jgi:polysaccharide export outer membrane protein